MAEKEAARLLRKHNSELAVGGAYDDVDIGPVPDDQEWHIRRFNCSNDDNAITKRGFLVKSGGAEYWVTETMITTAGRRYGLEINTVLGPGETATVRLTGCTAGDTINSWLTGVWYQIKGS